MSQLKLHSRYIDAQSWQKPCGPSVISILTGKPIWEIVDEMLAFRRARRRYKSEYTYGTNRHYYADGSTMYLREMMHFLRPFTSRHRPMWAPKKTIVRHMCGLTETVVLATSHHFAIAKDGHLYDNQWHHQPINYTCFASVRVHYIIPLDKAA